MLKPKYVLEGIAIYIVVGLIRLIPLDAASAFGGWVLSLVGPCLKVQKVADKNLQHAMPELIASERKAIIHKMWNHLGRVGVEFILLSKLPARTQIHGMENLPPIESPGLILAAHLGNWEIISALTKARGQDILAIYRHINNPILDRFVKKSRGQYTSYLAPKGFSGVGAIVRAIKDKRVIGIMADQRLNNGIEVPFFGQPAMTAPAIAEFALKYQIPVIPIRVIRKQGAHFEAFISPPIFAKKTGDHEADVFNFMVEVNTIIEQWIRETPEQWFWVHKRWGKL